MARLLLLVWICASIATVTAIDKDKLLASPQSFLDDINDVCDLLGPLVPLPSVKSDELCTSTGFNNNTESCKFVNFVQNTLPRINDGSSCRAGWQSPAAGTSLQGTPLPFPFSDQRPLPESLPHELLAREGASYYWLWRNVLNFQQWSSCAATNNPQLISRGTPKAGNVSQDWIVPRGWTVHSTVWRGNGSDATSLYLPLATVLYKPDSITVLIRGTKTIEDWASNFDYIQEAVDPKLQMPIAGKVHRGFANVTASIWPHLRFAMSSLLSNNSTGGHVQHVYIAGHSLGGAVATLVAYLTQELVGPSVKVHAVLFAAPNVGDAVFASAFASKVNARRIAYLNDIVPQVPCTPTTVACPEHAPNPDKSGLWQYSSTPGNLRLLPSDMPQQADAWSLFGQVYSCQATRFMQATHSCSYSCFLSQFVADSNNLCRLWAVPAGTTGAAANGSYCHGFPTDAELQYPYRASVAAADLDP